MGQLLERHRSWAQENQALSRELAAQQDRTRELEAQVLELNQRRQDVAKRVDDLIAQIELLEGKLGGGRE